MATIKSIEEKAKAYDEVMCRAKKELDACGSQDCDAARQIFRLFPELKESEDERIRGNIIATIHLYYGEPLEDEAKEMIAWLERQGEQKPAWSEEDERKLQLLIVMCDETKGDSATYSTMYREMEELKTWLKSLKDRYTWKPNDESFNNTSCTCLSKKEAESKVWKQ